MAQTSLLFNIFARNNTGPVLASVAGGFKKLGAVMGFAGVAAGIGSAVNKAAEFDKTIRLAGTTAGASSEQMKVLASDALKIGTNSMFGAQGAADAMLELAKGGISIAQMKAGALAGTMTLAAAGGLGLGDAATYMTNTLNTFGLSADKSSAVAAALAGGANASTASVESLGMALSQVGPGAKNAGLSMQETVGVLAAFDNAGIKGSDAGTSLKTMLTRLVPTTDAAAGAMRELGLDFTDAKGNFLPVGQVAQQLKDKLGGLNEESKTLALTTLFGSDATRAASVLMDEGAAGIAKYTTATSDLTAAQKLQKEQESGAAGSFRKFHAAVDSLQIAFGTTLLPTITAVTTAVTSLLVPASEKIGPLMADVGRVLREDVAPFFTPIVDAIMRLGGTVRDALPGLQNFATSLAPAFLPIGFLATEVLPRLVDVVGLAVTALSGLGNFFADHSTIVGTVAVAVGAFATAVVIATGAAALWSAVTGGLVTAFWLLNAAMTANPIGLVIGLVAALAAAFIFAWKKSETFRDIVSGVWNTLVGAVGAAVKTIIGVYGFMVDKWLWGFQKIAEGMSHVPIIGGKFEGIANAIQGVRDGVGNMVDDINAKVASLTQTVQIDVNVVTHRYDAEAVGQNQADLNEVADEKAAAARMRERRRAEAPTPVVSVASIPQVSASSFTGGGGGGGTGTFSRDADKAVNTAADEISRAMKSAGKRVKASKFVASITGDREKIKASFDSLFDDLRAAHKTRALRLAKGVEADLLGLAKTRDKIADRLKASKELIASVRGDFLGNADITGFGTGEGTFSFDRIRGQLQRQAADARAYADALTKLRKLKLNRTTMDQLVAAGPEQGMNAVQQLVQVGKSGVDEINRLMRDIGRSGARVGEGQARELYGTGVKAAEGLIQGLESQEAKVEKAMAKMARKMVTSIKRELGIRSPSQVMRGLARRVPEGYALGVEDGTPLVARAAAGMAAATLVGQPARVAGRGTMPGQRGVDANTPVLVLDLAGVGNDALVMAIRQAVKQRGGDPVKVLGGR